MKKPITMGILIIFSLTNYVNGEENIIKKQKIYDMNSLEKRIFKVKNDYINSLNKELKAKTEINCYSEYGEKLDYVDFTCDTYFNGLYKPGCGIKIGKQLDKLEGKCEVINDKKTIEFNFLYTRIFPKNLDIFDKLYKHSIQEEALNCEISATSDIISTVKNEDITQEELSEKLEKSEFYNKTSYQNKDDVKIWGNPNYGYVGYSNKIDGKEALQRKYEGYGVYEKPIQKLYKDYGIETKIITRNDYEDLGFSTKMHLTELLKELNNGNYVQFWADYCTYEEFEDGQIKLNLGVGEKLSQSQIKSGINAKNLCYKPKGDRTLKRNFYDENGDLQEFKGLNGEHAFYLLGYEGGIETPSHIIVWDTFTGKHTYKIEEWLRKWDLMDNKSIIIYNN